MTLAAEIPVPPEVRSLVVCGGAFDPPHRAHFELPPIARDALGAGWLLYVPAARTPLKAGEPGASGEQRLAMMRLALAGAARASVSDIEVRRAGVSYTVDTLRAFRAALPHVQTMRLLIGADQAAQFHRWREPREIISLAEPAVMLRPPAEGADALLDAMGPHWSGPELERWRARVVTLPRLDVSSTTVRDLLRREGPEAPGLRSLVPAPVLDYIARHALYVPEARGGRRT